MDTLTAGTYGICMTLIGAVIGATVATIVIYWRLDAAEQAATEKRFAPILARVRTLQWHKRHTAEQPTVTRHRRRSQASWMRLDLKPRAGRHSTDGDTAVIPAVGRATPPTASTSQEAEHVAAARH